MPIFSPPNIERLFARKDIAGLKKAEKHKDPKISYEAKIARQILEAPLEFQQKLTECASPTPTVRAAAVRRLGGMHYSLAGPTLEKLVQTDPSLDVRQEALRALKELHYFAEELYLQCLDDPDETLRATAAACLSRNSTRWVVEGTLKATVQTRLRKALAEDTPTVRAEAAFALTRLYTLELLDTNIKQLLSHGDWKVRWKTALALGDFAQHTAPQPAVLALLSVLGDENTTVRMAAAQYLGDIGDKHFKVGETFWQDFITRL